MKKNDILAGLAILLIVVTVGGTLAIVDIAAATKVDSIRVFDIHIDPRRQCVDIIFERPVPGVRSGNAINPPAAKIEPALRGVWSWETESVLRFCPSSRFRRGVNYRIILDKRRLGNFRGDAELTFAIDE